MSEIYRGGATAGQGTTPTSKAENVTIEDEGNLITATNVEDALQELAVSADSSIAGVNTETLTGDRTLGEADVEYQRLDPNGAVRDIYLSTAATVSNGKVFRITNTGTELLTIKQGVSSITTLITNEEREFWYDGATWTDITKIVLEGREIDLTNNTLTGTTAEFNTALSDDDFATLAGVETLTNKTVVVANNTITTAASGELAATELNAALAELEAEKVQKTSDTGSSKQPTGTTVERDGSPADGYLRHNSDLDKFEGYFSDASWGWLADSRTVYVDATTINIGTSSTVGSDGTTVGNSATSAASGVSIGDSATSGAAGTSTGRSSTAGNNGTANGYFSNAAADSTAMGYRAAATKALSIGLGKAADTSRTSEMNINITGEDANNYMRGSVGWGGTTNTTSPTEIFLGKVADERLTLPADSLCTFDILVTGMDGSNNDCAAYRFKGAIHRNTGNDTVIVGGSAAKDILAEDDAAFDCAVTADDTNEALIITVTSATANGTKWAAQGQIVEVRD